MNLVLNSEERTVVAGEKCSHLTPKEFGILEFLMANPNKTFSPEEIYERIWECEPFACEPIIAVHLRHIREKIEVDPSDCKYIKTEFGKGYIFSNKYITHKI